MKIAVFASNYPPHPGGLEAVVHNVAAGLAARHDVVVISTAWGGRAGTSAEDGLTVFRMPAIHRTERWGVPYPVLLGRGLRKAIDHTSGAHLIHAHGALYQTTLLAARLARRTASPLVLTEHVGFVRYRRRLLNVLQQAAWSSIGSFTLRSAAALTVYNTRVESWLKGVNPGRPLHFIPNGVDHDRFAPRGDADRCTIRKRLGWPEKEVVALFVGRHTEKKNLDAVLRIPRHAFSLAVCGARRNLTGDRIFDLGIVPHDRMARIYHAADFMIHASDGEGFPLAVQEAMATGLPVVLLWDNGYSANLDRNAVLAIDSVDDLARAVVSVASDAALRERLGETGHAWARDHWLWKTTVMEYERLFSRLVADRSYTPRHPTD